MMDLEEEVLVHPVAVVVVVHDEYWQRQVYWLSVNVP